MKTKSIILALLSVAFVSCTKEIIERNGVDDTEIGFTAYSGGFTRGVEVNSAAKIAEMGGFKVWTYHHTDSWLTATDKVPIITGNVTSSNGTEWNYGPRQWWPFGKKISSFAYAPVNSSVSSNVDPITLVPSITYTVSTAAGSQEDILIADEITDQAVPTPLNEMFHHVLSRIELNAIKAPGEFVNDNVIITKAELQNIYSTGTASLYQNISEENPAVWDLNNASLTTYTFSVSNGTLVNLPLTTEEQNLLPGGNAGKLLMMPQVVNRSGVNLAIEYTVNGLQLEWQGPIPTPEEWLSGKSYKYTLRIGGKLVAIVCGQLEPTIPGDPWGDF